MITLGILETDTLYPDLLDEYRSYGQMFAHFFDQLPHTPWQYRFYQVTRGELPDDMMDCDAYLITGSKTGVYDEATWLEPLANWIHSAYRQRRPLIGICFGHQILAHSLGGHAAQSDRGWGIGIRTSHVTTPPVWMKHTLPAFRLIYSHRDQVNTLPPGAEKLAGCAFCENAAFVIDDRVLGFQGHPEFTREYLQRLLPRRRECIGEDTYQEGMGTLTERDDSQQVGQWLIDFIEHPRLD